MDNTFSQNPPLNNGISATMALESSSPFGVNDSPVQKGRSLFAENNEPASTYMYPFNASRNFTSVFSGVSYANSMYSNTNHVASSTEPSKLQPCFNSALGQRFEIKEMDDMDSDSGDEDGDETLHDDDDDDDDKENSAIANHEREHSFTSVNMTNVRGEKSEGSSARERDLGDLSDSNEEPVECGNCDNEFRTLQDYMDHSCAGNKSMENMQDSSAVLNKETENHLSDVESFDGKIVYNPDGSAYIIEGDSDSELESIIDIPQKEGLIIDRKGKHDELTEKPIPQIDNAFFVPRNPNSFINSMYMLPHKLQTPIMHSYRVYDLRSQKPSSSPSSSKDKLDIPCSARDMESSSSHIEKSSTSSTLLSSPMSSSTVTSVPTKPILMCFICKLSFGFAKSFTSHAISEHSMVLSPEEKEIMSRKNSSAIIQGIGKEKEPLMSFLEPIKSSGDFNSSGIDLLTKTSEDSVSETVAETQSSLKETTNVSYVYTKPKLSDSLKGLSSKSQDQLNVDNRKDTDSPAAAVLHALQHKTLNYNKLENSFTQSDKKKLNLDLQEDSDSSSGMFMNHTPVYMQEDQSNNMNLSSKSYAPHLPSPMISRPTFFGGCEEHPHGRAQGVECPNCDMILSSSQSLGGHMTMMHSRNSCKTLKCPKCNWHYKYQETLEIHMKEKHPDSDQKCMYCLTNQSHPRLARGESYSCGYKPYRCEVCNYSTTTKGNLSIHMQSDKHLNNVQDLANGGGEMKVHPQHTQPPAPSPQQAPPPPSQPPVKTPPHQQLIQQPPQQTATDSLKKNKPKPTWRCDVCNYETNVARNLRIHMTSEKHTHNMMVLQQNMKHMQRDMQLHQMNQLVMLQQDPSFLGLGGPIPGGVTFPYDGSLMLGGLPSGFGEAPVDLSKENGISVGASDGDLNDVSKLFQCCVCNVYGSDSLENLHQHLQQDRTKQHESENIVIASGTYICNLCTYKTNLKANFQLHCKTDKHLQRLQLVNHIKEGGDNNEWRLKYLNVSNPIQVRCNACDYYTNSINKLQIHTGNPRHEASAQLFCHLQMQESKLACADKYYHCVLCKFNARSKLGLMQHVHSMQHLHSESLKQMEMKETGQLEIDIGDIFVVKEIDEASSVKFDDEDGETEEDRNYVNHDDIEEKERPGPNQKINNNSISNNNNIINNNNKSISSTSSSSGINNNNNNNHKEGEPPVKKGEEKTKDQVHVCPFCTYSSVNEMHIKTHVLTQHSQSTHHAACPLCQESLPEKSKIEAHLKSVHNVNAEGLQRLLQLVEDSKLKMPPTTKETLVPSPTPALAEMTDINIEALEAEFSKLAAEDAIDTSINSEKDLEDHFRCQTCTKAFTNIDHLYAHQNELGHLELKQTPRGPGYLCWKKGCNQYFKTAQALQMHFREIHAKRMSVSDRSVYKYQCSQCTLAFSSPEKLQLHAHIHLIRSALICNFCTKSFQSISSMKQHVEVTHDLSEAELEQYNARVNINVMALATLISNSGLNVKLFIHSESATQSNGTDNSKSELGKENEKMDIDESDEIPRMSSEYSSKDHSSSSTPVSLENGIDKQVNSDIVDKDLNDMNSEQSVFEDYINSQAFAEGAYEDPTRKHKCHRCRVAFTKQIYLISHNKTLLHKKGERLNYPMEKYLDPNRPYKCDVCKESFTQNNILLVHYNSVSHLHKVKQASLSDSSSPSTTAPSYSQSVSSVISVPSTSTPASTSSSLDKKEKTSNIIKSQECHTAEDDMQRPYKCNICKVSYSQGSTLDIHIRSVAHQTKASKLQELAMTGEIDLSKPLIEEPTTQAQQQKLITDILNMQTSIAMTQMTQPSMLFQGLPSGLPSFPGIPSIPGLPLIPGLPPLLPLSLSNQMLPSSQSNASHSSSKSSKPSASVSNETASSANKSLEKISQQLMSQQQGFSTENSSANYKSSAINTMSSQTQSQNIISGNVQVCQCCSAVFASQESFIQHQLYCSGSSSSPSALSSQQQTNSPVKSRGVLWRVKPQVQRSLLENFGFECVMQFNEFNQPLVKKEETKDIDNNESMDSDEDNDNGNPSVKESENPSNERKEEGMVIESGIKYDSDIKVKEEILDDEKKVDLPEMNKCVCKSCGKQFSSVWVLKAHQEEVHKDIVPIGMVEDVGDQFKTDLESKLPKEPDLPPIPTTPSTPLEESLVKQEMPPPPLPQPQMQMDMLQMMSMFGMMPMPVPGLLMNTQPAMMPMMLPPQGLDQGLKSPNLAGIDTSAAAHMSAQHKQQLAQQAAMANQKRARTRINDEQLKVLRGYFDINNSPSEEQIQAMSEQTTLPMKVIKHWFRNTLFKERQRNKDSPYNFSNPPSTTLDLEEYEKTGKLSIVENPQELNTESPAPKTEDIESEIKKEECTEEQKTSPKPELSVSVPVETSVPISFNPHNPGHQHGNPHTNPHSTPNPGPFDSQPSTSTSRSPSPTVHDSLMDSMGSVSSHGTPIPSYPPTSTTPIMPPLYEHHNYSPPGGSSGRRANRTRFTDYQVRVLQEYFEQNAYPKDDELEHLSKLLKLSPRVIVVWFQNARQKARKIYENQPAEGNNKEGMHSSSATSPFQRTPGLNYQCKKCSAVFQRYYDLIRHQKRSCFTDAEKKETHMMSDDSDSLSQTTSLDDMYFSDQESETSSNVSKTTPASTVKESGQEPPKYSCEKCDMSFPRLELWREHQNMHNMNPGLFRNFPSNSAFDVLQNMAAAQQQQHDLDTSMKRKFEADHDDDPDQPRDKRLRTTILPEQLDYLYQKYQIDCNPSRKQLEAISKDVGLKKRVVQVWFQNTRARERKGQYRAHQQLIHKRCPICRALFRAKSALESHLATKHPDEMAKGEINIDAIPDAAVESPSSGGSFPTGTISPSPDFNPLMTPPGMQGLLPLIPPASLPGMSFPPMADPIQLSMKQFYEDSFKKYINELSSTPVQKGAHPVLPAEITSTPIKSERPIMPADDDAPLDLSKPMKKENRDDEKLHEPSSSKANRPAHLDHSNLMQRFAHDSMVGSESFHDSREYRDEESSNLSSNPASPGQPLHHLSTANKRYRTQMTSLQVRIMKNIFIDYKTPTMAECEMLGRIIGLQKRVVQVWFQNARAKEKKAKLNMAKAYGQTEIDFPKPPEECTLCNFKYSHKYTIQDHIFTKKHIDNLKTFIQTQSQAERDLTHTSMSGASGLMRSQQPAESDIDNMRKLMEEATATQSQMAQLQSMGLGPLGLPPGALAGMGPLMNPADFMTDMKKDSSSSREKERKEEEKRKDEGSTKKEPQGMSASDASQLHGLNFLSPFGGFMPGMDPGLLPLMYPGLPGMMGPGMPPLPPGLMPGTEHLLGYDPMTFGTPLPLLQIPQQAIRDVSSKLMDPKASVGQYTQDCKSISSLKSLVRSADYSCAREATVDVGYICKKCQMVYPAKEACVNHQRMVCFPGGKTPEGIIPILKLEQIQYECKLCSDKVSSVQDFKSHCQSETHTLKLMKYQQQKAALGGSMKSPGSSSTASATVTSDAGANTKERTITLTKTNLIGSFADVLDQSVEQKLSSEVTRDEKDKHAGAD